MHEGGAKLAGPLPPQGHHIYLRDSNHLYSKPLEALTQSQVLTCSPDPLPRQDEHMAPTCNLATNMTHTCMSCGEVILGTEHVGLGTKHSDENLLQGSQKNEALVPPHHFPSRSTNHALVCSLHSQIPLEAVWYRRKHMGVCPPKPDGTKPQAIHLTLTAVWF